MSLAGTRNRLMHICKLLHRQRRHRVMMEVNADISHKYIDCPMTVSDKSTAPVSDSCIMSRLPADGDGNRVLAAGLIFLELIADFRESLSAMTCE